ncbi:hypothetical protein OUK_1172 [Helicobacter pylori R037c]|nr:hypothetical protein OUK_1172 [Helicobacter pylori R037c]
MEFIEFKKCFSIFKINNKRACIKQAITLLKSGLLGLGGFNWGL